MYWTSAAAVFALRVFLAGQQDLYIWVGGAPLDDELMYRAAQSITAGHWLGTYDYLTLSKQMFFAVWLAFCHTVHVPYLAAGQLLMCGAALAMAQALAPVLRSYRGRFLLFAALAFSPAAAASFTLRVYRDNIFPAECLLLFAGLTGVAMRSRQGLRHWWGWLVLAGVGLGTARLTREDGIWLLPFAVVGTALILGAVWLQKDTPRRARLARSAALLVPFGILAGGVLAMSAMNWCWYGVFATSDFSEGSFADAYGAMTRLQSETVTTDRVPVPRDVREKLYVAVPQLRCLEYWLEYYQPLRCAYESRESGDYEAGSFYWVLRRAAQQEGVYDSAQDSDAYWREVADAINAAINDGTLKANHGPRRTTTPIIRPSLVAPTLREAAKSLVYCLTFRDCSCYLNTASGLSMATPEDAAAYKAYLGDLPNYAAIENSDLPYYTPRQLRVYRAVNAVWAVYAAVLPAAFCAALVLQARRLVQMVRRRSADGLLLWLTLLGILLMALLRCAIIAFMEVAAFNIGTYVMYLSSVHPLLITYAAAGILTGWPRRTAPQRAADAPAQP